MAQINVVSGIGVFVPIWIGQTVSLLGSGLTGFALGIWVYQQTGSVTQFALISFFTALPGVLISPLAGTLVDRWDRRKAMLLSDLGAGLSTSAIALLLFANRLSMWHIYLAMAIVSTFSAFQWLAYTAATTVLVPKKHLGRASGMVQLAEATAQILSPALAGLLVVKIQIQGVILIDVSTFIFSVVTLLLVRFPKLETTLQEEKVGKGLLRREVTYGWTYITTRSGLLGLLMFLAVNNFVTGVVSVLVTPLVLSFASITVLGTVQSVAGSGMLIGSLLMSVWGGSSRRVYSLLSFTLLGGLCIIITGLRPSVPVFFVAGFLYFFGLPIINGSSQAIWQSKVAPLVQGRVFAVRRMIAWSSLPLAYLVAGPLADRVFQPLLVVDGPLAGNIGRIIGVGPGYGIALLFVVMGMLMVLTSIGGYLYPRLRLVEEELPDA
ncbi:MFS transporter [Scytonema sp. UIC 10036]|uniref:MFS transporter n=1 Tax=Scytonema sp. UIC 10036 TaxID=2304196 RepID=UPI0012DAD72D|nr:MFS transporter [Scytonema sp. UIC 10036]MUG96213.1 MFS transporter [Scytonema sp. UIC 10036]